MKNYNLLCVIAATVLSLVIFSVICANAEAIQCEKITYDGVIAPTDMLNVEVWQKEHSFQDNIGLIHVLFKAIDENAEIKYVECVFSIIPGNTDLMLLVGYVYEYRGETYVIVNRGAKCHYEQVQPPKTDI